MGGKNSAPKPPDYGPLAAASQKSADYAYQLAQRQQDWAEQTYNDNKALTDTVINKALGSMDQQEADAARDRQRYETIFQPLEEQLASDAESYSSPERMEQEAGKAEADVAAQFASARQTAQNRLESFGVDPSQTRAGALDLGTRVAEAAAQASAGNQARTQTENTGRALRSEAINVGRGYPGQIQASMSGQGQAGNAAANTGLAQTASGANTMGIGSTWQGMGNNAIGQWGNILNTGYSNAMDQYKANQDSSSGWGNILGMGASLALKGWKGFAEGGAIPDGGGPVPPDASPSNGAIPDDVPAQLDSGAPARLNAGEFVIPKDVTGWLGEKGIQQLILKARKEMSGANGERPAQPQAGPPIPPESVGAIPMPPGS
jgi:hypothetical protein